MNSLDYASHSDEVFEKTTKSVLNCLKCLIQSSLNRNV